jgi:hypothetical protein
LTSTLRRAWILPLFAAIGALLIVVGWPCPIRAVVGYPCPTCGTTRALRLALRGDFAGATQWHPLVWVTVPFVAVWLGIEIIGYLRTGAWGASSRVRHGTKLLVAIAAALFVVWIVRFCGGLGGAAPP